MKVLLSWLRDFVPIEEDPDRLAERMSLSGLTVEEVVRTGADISNVVVGEVRSVREHPNADNLVLVKAFDGTAERDIVCGARNFAAGDRVPLALPGARLPGGMEIAERVVRGEPSQGMLCSAKELRVADDHSGILVLDPDAPLGKDIGSALELDDVVFDLDITTNRGDLLSVVGIAREIAALYELPLTIPAPVVPETGGDIVALAAVEVQDARGCPRYVARVVEGVRVGPSPWWLRRRLLACGMRPISNVVDVTNHVMLERGQPLHAFDLDRLTDARIVVRRARKGEAITTLDGVDRKLTRDDVVIADGERAVAIAGVMGGADAEVSEATTRILLESATFDPIRVRTTAARLGMRTEASARFEKGSDPELPSAAADRACELFASVAGGSVARGSIDAYMRPTRRKPIKLRTARAATLIGASPSTEEIDRTLRAIGCEVEVSRSAVRATPPSWRPDLSEEVDLVEEVARFYGYARVPDRLPAGARTGGLSDEQRARRTARTALLGAGLHEAQTLSLIPPSLPERMRVGAEDPLRRAARVTNPLSEEESVLRPSLLPGLLLAAQRNVARRVLPVALFEMGIVFEPATPVEERWSVGLVLAGPAPGRPHALERALDFFDAKGAVAALTAALGVAEPSFEEVTGNPTFHPGRAAAVVTGGRRVGVVAELHPRTAAAFELPARVAVAELDLTAVLGARSGARAIVPPRFPAVTRDLALVVSGATSVADITEVIRSAGGPLLESVRLFDRYEGEQIAAGAVSVAFSMAFRAPDRTLSDADADAAVAAIVDAAGARGWTVRA